MHSVRIPSFYSRPGAALGGTQAATIQHVRDVFHRMGFNDREIVALCGAHAVGRCHTDRSGFWGPWTRAESTFSNEYFRELVENKWTLKKTHKGSVLFLQGSYRFMPKKTIGSQILSAKKM